MNEPVWVYHECKYTGRPFYRLEVVEDEKPPIKLKHIALIMLFIVGPVALASVCASMGVQP